MHDLFKKYGHKHLSISQIKTHEQCPKLWIGTRILGMETPKTAATDFGKSLHAHIENCFFPLDGFNIDEDQMKSAEELLILLNESDINYQGAAIEAAIEVSLHDDLPPFIGFVDMQALYNEQPVIIDHKTCAQKRYAKSADELLDDWQLSLYAHALGYSDSGVYVQHNSYIKARKKNNWEISRVWLPAETIKKNVADITEAALRMIDTLEEYDSKGFNGVTQGGEKCANAYGGKHTVVCGCRRKEDTFMFEPIKKQEEAMVTVADTTKVAIIGYADLMREAKERVSNKKFQNKFDASDALLDAAIEVALEKQTQAVILPAILKNGGDAAFNKFCKLCCENFLTLYVEVT